MKTLSIHATLLLPFLFLLPTACDNASSTRKKSPDADHSIVFSEEGKYAGWPANNGIWNWGDEILVGFVEAAHKESKGIHTYDPATAKNKYARSKDGGRTWIIEDAYEHGQTAWGHDNNVSKDKAVAPEVLQESLPDFTHPDFVITFQRHNNDNGPSHFYASNDRGLHWQGPYAFPDLDTDGVATRTDYIIEGKQEMNVFLTVAKSNKEEGQVVLVKTYDGGVTWKTVSRITEEQDGFDIMPSSVRLSGTELFTVIRTRTGNGQDLLTSYCSPDNGQSWTKLKDPVADTGRGGSPPALLKLKDGRLALAYIYRSDYGSRVNIRFSSDNGRRWSDEIVLRSGDRANRDAGYPRMVQRADGKLVLIYYWNNVNDKNATPYRYIASTLIDPDVWS
jgi:hypothetical protein